MKPLLLAVALIVLLICLLLAAACLAGGSRGLSQRLGGAARPPAARAPRRTPDPALSPHVVVDTLNFTHWHLEREAREAGGKPAPLTPEAIVAAIDTAAPVLKKRHPGRVMFVLKDRESQFNDAAVREKYRLAAERNGVYVSVAERFADPPAGVKPSAEHSSRGRDDFYMSLLAFRYRCAVVTADKLRDFSRFRATIPPFYVIEYTFWRDRPEREPIRPDSPAYARMRKPRTVHPAAYFGDGADAT
jgi:hypothetical protein